MIRREEEESIALLKGSSNEKRESGNQKNKIVHLN
jgi:hypothetical protein